MAELVAQVSNGVTAPTVDLSGALLAVSSGSGEIHQVLDPSGAPVGQRLANTTGTPSALCVDSDGTLYVCDLAHQAILRRGADGELTEFVREYEGKPLKGPSGVVVDRLGNTFFCDSGPLGETTLQAPQGSVFTISADGQLLQPLALECLAHPSGLAVSPLTNVLYVTEQLANRIVRFAQRPAGVYHASVFYQFSGRMGPSAVACHPTTGSLYVALFDFASPRVPACGSIAVISPEGTLIGSIEVPAPEVTGLALFPPQDPKFLFVTEASTGSVYKVAL